MIKKLFILFLLFGVSLGVYADPTKSQNWCVGCWTESVAGKNGALFKTITTYDPVTWLSNWTKEVPIDSKDSSNADTNTPGWTNTPANTPSNTTTDTSSTDNILGISQDRLRTGNITYTDIPLMIVNAIEFLLAIAGSISVVALIYHAVRMQLASGITGDASGVDKAKKWMYGAMFGFVLSMSGWFLMTKFVALLSGSV